MRSMKEALMAADRKTLVNDVVKLIDEEVARKKGVTGLALKGGYRVVKKLKSGRMIQLAVGHLLDDFTDAIEPIHAEFREKGDGSFVNWLRKHEGDAANALLGITDRRAHEAEQAVLKKTYSKLRPQAERHVRDALPGLGRLIEQYTAG